MKGIYSLLIHLSKGKNIKVGKLGIFHFPEGYYIYVGSAMNGIEQRVTRHKRKEKKKRWHIDYLLEEAEVIDVFIKGNVKRKEECKTVNEWIKKGGKILVKGFGSSDCKCETHLLYFGKSFFKIKKK